MVRKPIAARIQAHAAMFLISAANPVGFSFVSCITSPILVLVVPTAGVIGHMCAASQQEQADQKSRGNHKNAETGFPDRTGNSGPASQPGKNPPHNRDGHGSRKSDAGTRDSYHPQA